MCCTRFGGSSILTDVPEDNVYLLNIAYSRKMT